MRKNLLSYASYLMAGALVMASTPLSVGAADIESVKPSVGLINEPKTVLLKGSGFTSQQRPKFVDIVAGVEHLVALDKDGHVWTVGRNDFGQLGVGDNRVHRYAVKPIDITDKFNLNGDRIAGINSGDYHSFAITENGQIYAWGRNDHGQLSTGNANNAMTPVNITGKIGLNPGEKIVYISGGVDNTFIGTSGGRTLLAGYNNEHQDGNDDYTDGTITNADILMAKPVEGLGREGGFKYIEPGNHSLIGRSSGGTYTWGRNRSGESGTGYCSRYDGGQNDGAVGDFDIEGNGNFKLKEGDSIETVQAGDAMLAALSRKHRVFVWGSNRQSMLGLSDSKYSAKDDGSCNENTAKPIDITDKFPLKDGDYISDISVGNSHVLGLSNSGRIFSWGMNNYGQLGNGEISATPSYGIDEITDKFYLPKGTTIDRVIAAGNSDSDMSSYSYALDSDGNIYAWGGSKFDRRGINSLSNTTLLPTKISDRLLTERSAVLDVTVDDNPLPESDYTVESNKLMRINMPVSDEAKTVDIVVTVGNDDEAQEIHFDKAYTYKEPAKATTEDDDKDDTDEADDTKSNDKGVASDDDKDSKDAKNDANKSNTKSSSTKSSASSSKNKSNSAKNPKSSTKKSSTKKSTGGKSSSSAFNGPTGYTLSGSSKVTAPNTGAIK